MAMIFSSRRFLFAALGCSLLSIPVGRLTAQQSDSAAAAQQPAAPANGQNQEADPRKRQLSDQELYAKRKAYRIELSREYRKWLDEEVPYIISDDERKAFLNLSNDEERESFIESFWLRRNPNPDSPENEFREEHYRRIAYANEHFAAGKPGWKTDRGRIYIMWGKPDETDSHPSGGTYERPMDEGGGETSTFPFEVWRYRYLEGIGENVELEFVDSCQCGDYHFTIDRGEKDALAKVPGLGQTMYEQMSHKDKTDRNNGGLETLGKGMYGSNGQESKEFDRVELQSKIFAPPPIKYADLDAFISQHKVLSGPPLPFDVRTDFVKVTESTDLVPITIQIRNRDITFVTKDGVSKGVVNILGKVTTIMHKTVQTFEDTVEVDEPAELLEKTLDAKRIYWKALPLQPGLYRLDIAIKDVNNQDHVGIYAQGINVPIFQDEKLGTSSLILADEMYTVPSRQIGGDKFIIGNTFVRPRVTANAATPASYKRSQPLSFWMQVYNLGIDEVTKSNSATVTYQITDMATNAVILEKQIDSKDLGVHSDQLTVEKTLPIAGLAPGKYKVTVKIDDAISKQEIAQTAPFVVE